VTIGLICAIPQELAHLRDALAHADAEEVAHARFDKGGLDGHEVVLGRGRDRQGEHGAGRHPAG
jgi:adenosylhomocysteine nucleosidase